MSYDPAFEREWAGELRRFRLGTGEIIRLQDKAADDGPWAAFEQLRTGRCRIELVHEVIRQGLIGAGASANDAAAFIKEAVETTPPDERRILALEILATWMTGAETVPKKAEAAGGAGQPASTPPSSMETAPSSASRRKRSTPRPSGS